MDTKKWLYFAKEADEANLNGIDDVACLPAENLVSIAPSANNRVTLKFKSVKTNDPLALGDTVVLETIVGDAFEVANEIIRFINAGQPTDGFITIADDTIITDSAITAENDLPRSSIYAHKSITGVNAINIGIEYTKFDYPVTLHSGNVPQVMAGNAVLAVNTHHSQAVTATRAYTIPSAAAGRAGDWISIFYIAAIAAGANHTYTTTTDTSFAIGSTLRIPSGSADARVGVAISSDSNDDRLTFTGLANGDGGVGTRVMLRNQTGEANGWALEAVLEGQGTTAAASAGSIFS